MNGPHSTRFLSLANATKRPTGRIPIQILYGILQELASRSYNVRALYPNRVAPFALSLSPFPPILSPCPCLPLCECLAEAPVEDDEEKSIVLVDVEWWLYEEEEEEA
jgi:hypothetical protein